MSKVNKKKRNKRLRSLVLLLFLTIVMLSTATYAWFTSNRTVKIDTINVNIAATSGLQISADAITWKSILSNSDLTGAISTYSGSTNNLTATMGPVSTAGTVQNGLMKFYSGSVEGDANGDMALTTLSTADDGNLYVVFDIFLKTDTAATVYLEKGSGVTPSTAQDDKGLQNAARYAFLTEGNGASTTAPATAQGWKTGTASTLTIIEPNYDVHTSTGVDNAKRYYGYNDTTAPGQTGANPVPYYGVDAAVSQILLGSTNPPGLSSPTANFATVQGTIFKTDAAYSTAANGFKYIQGNGSAQTGTYVPLFNQLAAGITKVRVYMWVEGQDIDCENNASGTNLSYKISLTLDNAS